MTFMYPVIIIGAGASTDYINRDYNTKPDGYIPPLSNNLFDPKRFEKWMNKRPEISGLVADALTYVPHKFTIEQYLTKIRAESKENESRKKQLLSMMYYLQDLFFDISENYGNQTSNNLKALINKINDKIYNSNGAACFISFNYDILLEQNLTEYISDSLDSYIRNQIRVIKPHGSCDWVYYIESHFNEIKDPYKHVLSYTNFLEAIENQKLSLSPRRRTKNFMFSYTFSNENGRANYCPALALPLENKQKFICPQSHIDKMVEALKQTDRILIVGWRANDKNLKLLIAENIQPGTKVKIVSGKKSSAEEIKNNLVDLKSAIFDISEKKGFSDFMKSGECDDFLNK